MDAALLLNISPILLAMLFGVLCFILWRKVPKEKLLLYYSATFTLAGSGLLLSFYTLPDDAPLWVFLRQGFHCTASVIAVAGMAAWAGRPFRLSQIAALDVASIAIIVGLRIGMPENSAYLWASNLTVGTMFFIGLLRSRNMFGVDTMSSILWTVFGLVCLQFFLRPLFSLPSGADGTLAIEGYYVVILSSALALSAVFLGLAVVGVGVRSLLTDALTESQMDRVTGLMSRGVFEARATRQILKARFESPTNKALLLVSIDNYEDLAQGIGFQSREKVLSLLGQTVQYVAGKHDLAGRFDGKMLAILLSNVGVQEAGAKVQDLNLYFQESLQRTDLGRAQNPIVSIGIARMLIADDFTTLFRRAGQSLNFAQAQETERTYLMMDDEVVL